MSGTNHAKHQGWAGPQPVVILVRPQMGENIGAAARAMWNFGLEHMRLVDPRDGWPNPSATAMASGAAQVLDQIKVTPDLPSALDDMTYVYATTARNRDLTKEIFTPEAAMQDAGARIEEGQKVGILFGAERAGLENSEIVRANALINIPVNPAFASLNLSQAVLLLAYEWKKNASEVEGRRWEMAGADEATNLEVEKLYDRMETQLDAEGFFWPEEKAQSMKENLRNMLARMPMTQADIRTWHGIFRKLDKNKK